jgi:hypothetical protein
MITDNFKYSDKYSVKLTVFFVFSLLLLASCKSNHSAYEYRPSSQAFDRKPVSKIEKAWIARHQYDHERRLLIPKLGGARWGAVQEYKENGTIEFRDWWERDVKIEDLEAVPPTVLSAPSNNKIKAILPQIGFDRQVVPGEETTPTGVPDPFPVNGFPDPSGVPPIPTGDSSPFPSFPTADDLPPLDAPLPSFPPSLDTATEEPGVSPFAPLPGSLPSFAPPGDLPPPAGLPNMEEGKPEEADPFPELPPDPFEKLP